VSGFDAVLVDAGGVLVAPDPAEIGEVLAPFGGSTDEATLLRAHYGAMRTQDDHSQDYSDWHVYRESFARWAGVDADHLAGAAEALDALFEPELWRFPLVDSLAALRALHEAGVPLGVVSNASGQIEEVLAALGVCQVGVGDGVPVVIVVDSFHVGVEKPDPAIFGFALEPLGLAPDRVVFVGDSVRNDVGGALAAGMQGVLLDPFGDHVDMPYPRIASLHELVPPSPR
jgi:putative hydrolase of the HAD superfamily